MQYFSMGLFGVPYFRRFWHIFLINSHLRRLFRSADRVMTTVDKNGPESSLCIRVLEYSSILVLLRSRELQYPTRIQCRLLSGLILYNTAFLLDFFRSRWTSQSRARIPSNQHGGSNATVTNKNHHNNHNDKGSGGNNKTNNLGLHQHG
jgi:hypothetical protein